MYRTPPPQGMTPEEKPRDGLLKQDAAPAGTEFATGGLTRQPYRGPSRVRRSDGQREYWVEGSGYVPETSLMRLPPQERQAVIDARETARQRMAMIPDLNRFEALNRTQPTGSLAQRVGSALGDVPEIIGDPEVEEMRAITDRLTPRMRPAGSGTTSDFDARMYRGSLPSRAHDGPTNSEIIAGLRRDANDAQQFAEFMDWYWPQRATTNGAQEIWSEYIQNRQPGQTWRQYFASQSTAPRGNGGAQNQQPRRRRFNPETGGLDDH